jgi:hypothetical protein
VAWYRAGTIAATVANVAPNRRRGAKTLKASDFVPKPPARHAANRDRKALRRDLLAFAAAVNRGKGDGG